MNETEWLACEDPVLMMSFLGTSFRGRKRLLVGMAICCRIRHLLDTDDARQTFVILERCADNLASDVEEDQLILLCMRSELRVGRFTYANAPPQIDALEAVSSIASGAYGRAIYGARRALARNQLDNIDEDSEARVQADLFRDIFGNPFRPVAFAPEWRTDTAMSLARGMYDSRDFSAMPILADALQDAGCDNADILDHCRDEKQVHVRGCWVVDLVLGKA